LKRSCDLAVGAPGRMQAENFPDLPHG
jgi:hypothetical protein